jgi:S1-C subfamily serine protease
MESPHDPQHDPSSDLEPITPDWGAPGEAPPPPLPGPAASHSPRRRLGAALLAAAMLLGGAGGFALTQTLRSGAAGVGTTSSVATTPTTSAGTSSAGTGSTGTGKLTLAQIEAKVDPALVDITSTLGNTGTAAGTGMVISSTGEILTNNHVISGATNISVKIGGTGTAYTATVVGYDVADDVAVLQIPNVSGLTTVTTASSSTVSVNDAIVAIGNALGKGGTPTAAQGVVAAVEQTITASDDTGSDQETLSHLIEVSAAVQPGDSGGATVDAYGRVVGMTTAAAASGGFRPMSTTTADPTTAYAIPIDSALAIAGQIEAGTASTNVHIGLHGLLGVQVGAATDQGGGVQVAGVQSASAAATAGLSTGDVIVSVNGRSISSISDLNDTMAATHVGDKLTVGWQDASGQSHEATVTLTTGAA